MLMVIDDHDDNELWWCVCCRQWMEIDALVL